MAVILSSSGQNVRRSTRASYELASPGIDQDLQLGRSFEGGKVQKLKSMRLPQDPLQPHSMRG